MLDLPLGLVRTIGWVALVVLVASPAAAATEETTGLPEVPLQGLIQPSDTIEATGLVTVGTPGTMDTLLVHVGTGAARAGDHPVTFRHLYDDLSPGPARAGDQVVSTDRALFEIITYRYVVDVPPLVGLSQQVEEYRDVFYATNVHLSLDQLRPQAEMLAYDAATSDPTLHATMPDAECDLSNPGSVEPFSYPTTAGSQQGGWRVPSNENRLQAQCRLNGMEIKDAGVLAFYGIDLELTSNERDEIIRTGSFDEPVVDGVPIKTRVVQVLKVHRSEHALLASWAGPVEATVHSTDFTLVGTMKAPAAEGNLHWGPLETSGRLDPLAATGVFAYSWHPESNIALTGRTHDGPGIQSQTTADAPVDARWIVVASATFVGLLAGLAAWLLYSRIDASQLLEHPRRRDIQALVEADPGIEVGSVAQRLGMRRTKAMYHVHRLRQAGHLKLTRVRGRTALYVANAGHRGHEERLFLLRRVGYRDVYEAVRTEPGMTQERLSKRVGRSQPQTSRILRQLEAVGAVELMPHSYPRRYRVPPIDAIAPNAPNSQ